MSRNRLTKYKKTDGEIIVDIATEATPTARLPEKESPRNRRGFRLKPALPPITPASQWAKDKIIP